jgi:hypothetical protein
MHGFKRWGFAGLALVLAAGWSYREMAFARDGPRLAILDPIVVLGSPQSL